MGLVAEGVCGKQNNGLILCVCVCVYVRGVCSSQLNALQREQSLFCFGQRGGWCVKVSLNVKLQ